MKIIQWETSDGSIRTSIEDDEIKLELIDTTIIEGWYKIVSLKPVKWVTDVKTRKILEVVYKGIEDKMMI